RRNPLSREGNSFSRPCSLDGGYAMNQDIEARTGGLPARPRAEHAPAPCEMHVRIPAEMEERANAITHGVGLLLAFVASAVLLATARRHGDAWNIWGCGIYVITLIAAYTASTLSHV